LIKVNEEKHNKQMAEKHKESNWQFVKAVENVMDDYRNRKLTAEEVIIEIEKIEHQFG